MFPTGSVGCIVAEKEGTFGLEGLMNKRPSKKYVQSPHSVNFSVTHVWRSHDCEPKAPNSNYEAVGSADDRSWQLLDRLRRHIGRWRGGWLSVPRGEGVSLLPRGSWDPARLLTCTTLVDKESFTTVSWRRDDTLLIAGTSKVCTQLEINELCVLQVSLGSFLVRPVFTVCWRWRNTWLSYQ